MVDTAAARGRLEEEALQQKELLKALWEKIWRKQKEEGEPKTKRLREEEASGELQLCNYVPEDEDLKRRVPRTKPEPVIEEMDLANLAPHKPDWDLKRDMAKKLEKLENQTQRAFAELIRKRLKGQEDNRPLQWPPPQSRRPVTPTEPPAHVQLWAPHQPALAPYLHWDHHLSL